MEQKTSKSKKRSRWIRSRHKTVTNIAKILLKPYVVRKYGIKIEKFKEQGERQYLILSNHQTGFDQFFVAYAFKGAVYYVASEDIFSMGFVSDLLRWAVNPIPIKKQTTDISAVLNCMRVAREGGTIAIFPEGNRTYSGHTEHINPAIAMLAKKLSLPIAFFKIEGGYGVAPRWGDTVRNGNMRAYVSKVVEPEEYKLLSDDELMTLIYEELYVNEATVNGEYQHGRCAEYLERAIHYCPKCNLLSTFESVKNTLSCKKCGMTVRYLPTKELEGVGFDLPYRFVSDWHAAQNAYINTLDLPSLCDGPLYREKGAIDEVIVYKNKQRISDSVEISLWGDRITVASESLDLTFDFDTVRTITVCGKNKLNIYYGNKVYQITGGKRFNALKYVNLAFRYRNIKKAEKGEKYDEFLGL